MSNTHSCSQGRLVADLEGKWRNWVFHIWLYFHGKKGELRSFLISQIPYKMVKHHLCFNYFCHSIDCHPGQWNCYINVFEMFSFLCPSLSSLESKMPSQLHNLCLQHSERPLATLFSFSSTLFPTWLKKWKREKNWLSFILLLILFMLPQY